MANTSGMLGADPRKGHSPTGGSFKAAQKQTTTDWFGGTGQGGIGYANRAAFSNTINKPKPNYSNPAKSSAEWDEWKKKHNIALLTPDPSRFGQKIREAADKAHAEGKLSVKEQKDERIVSTREQDKKEWMAAWLKAQNKYERAQKRVTLADQWAGVGFNAQKGTSLKKSLSQWDQFMERRSKQQTVPNKNLRGFGNTKFGAAAGHGGKNGGGGLGFAGKDWDEGYKRGSGSSIGPNPEGPTPYSWEKEAREYQDKYGNIPFPGKIERADRQANQEEYGLYNTLGIPTAQSPGRDYDVNDYY